MCMFLAAAAVAAAFIALPTRGPNPFILLVGGAGFEPATPGL